MMRGIEEFQCFVGLEGNERFYKRVVNYFKDELVFFNFLLDNEIFI